MKDWTLGEKNLIAAAAAAAAPSVHNTQPWVLEFHERHRVSLYLRLDRGLPRHDPLGRDRLISCGAALDHVLLGLRILGWTTELELCGDREHPDEVGRVVVTGRAEPSEVELARYAAVTARRSHRKPFTGRPSAGEQRELLDAQGIDGVGLRVVAGPDENAALARLLSHSALALRADHAYQRELTAWTAPVRDPWPGGGVSSAIRRTATLPWAGLVRRTTAIPDVEVLTDRLSREFLVLVVTPDDGPIAQVRAGMAVSRVWLRATAAGLAGAVLTQPFQLREARAGLVEALSLNGFPQLLLRVGHP